MGSHEGCRGQQNSGYSGYDMTKEGMFKSKSNTFNYMILWYDYDTCSWSKLFGFNDNPHSFFATLFKSNLNYSIELRWCLNLKRCFHEFDKKCGPKNWNRNIKRLSLLFSQTVFQQFSRSSNCKIPFAQSKHFSEADTISWSNMAYGYISGTSPYLVVSGWIRLWTCRCCSFSGNSSSPFLLLNSPTFYWWTSNFVLQKIIKPTILKSLNSTSVSLDFILAHYETIPNPLNHWTIRAIMGHP